MGAHGSVSALADRIKIARGADQGSIAGAYQWIHSLTASGTGISYETSNPYMACSSESQAGLCPHGDWTCNAMNVARTCSTFPEMGGTCVGLDKYPNAMVAEYGSISGKSDMQSEIL